jgi:hypothetical protein
MKRGDVSDASGMIKHGHEIIMNRLIMTPNLMLY